MNYVNIWKNFMSKDKHQEIKYESDLSAEALTKAEARKGEGGGIVVARD